ncbi:hypothetical protein NUW54_g11067 [Trametes sanguinea]|uniref:Uncharacterized protein n=1 Tax=Trametes sanguinea TaxID=158606 RepID=A0ACC1NMA9_9APHY|nr:hypothetical protein NUW54_g11067 [Trametes sanguinea]
MPAPVQLTVLCAYLSDLEFTAPSHLTQQSPCMVADLYRMMSALTGRLYSYLSSERIHDIYAHLNVLFCLEHPFLPFDRSYDPACLPSSRMRSTSETTLTLSSMVRLSRKTLRLRDALISLGDQGVELTVYILTIQAIRRRPRTSYTDKLLVVFSTILLLLNTIFVATESVFGEEMWVVNANYPGGSDAYLEDFASVWYQTFGTAASIVLNLFSDALMIYRCYIIWADVRLVLFPVVLYLATFGEPRRHGTARIPLHRIS